MKAMRAPYHKSEGLKHSFTVLKVFQPKIGDLPKYQIRASRELPRGTMQPAALPSTLRKTEGAKVVQLAHTLRCSIEQPLTIGIPQLPVLLTGSLAPLAQAACGRRLFSLAGKFAGLPPTHAASITRQKARHHTRRRIWTESGGDDNG